MTPAQTRMARAALAWSVKDLAAQAGVSPNTVVNVEMGRPVREQTLAVLQQAFERHGVVFTAAPLGVQIASA